MQGTQVDVEGTSRIIASSVVWLQLIVSICYGFLARDVVYLTCNTSHAYATMSVSVCPSVCL